MDSDFQSMKEKQHWQQIISAHKIPANATANYNDGNSSQASSTDMETEEDGSSEVSQIFSEMRTEGLQDSMQLTKVIQIDDVDQLMTSVDTNIRNSELIRLQINLHSKQIAHLKQTVDRLRSRVHFYEFCGFLGCLMAGGATYSLYKDEEPSEILRKAKEWVQSTIDTIIENINE